MSTKSTLSPVPMTGNLPPRVPDVFNDEYRAAMQVVMAEREPMDWIGVHQFLGFHEDREAGAQFVTRRLPETPNHERLVLAHSTQAILTVLCGSLVGVGGTLAVEELTYPTIAKFAKQSGFALVGVKLDDRGIIPDAFEKVCQERKPQALYTLPTLQNPTTSMMSLARREAIVAIAQKYGVKIFEDDIYSLLPERVAPPLASLAPEITYYMLGTAKSVGAGLKAAYLVTPETSDPARLFWPGSGMTYWMIAPANAGVSTVLIRNGGVDRIISAVREETRARQQMVTNALGGISLRTTPECLHVWMEAPHDRSVLDFVADCKRRGAEVGPAATFLLAGGVAPHYVRFGTGKAHDRAELQRGLEAIAGAYFS
ncbi:PLP-dependent aminotransferase family protein [Sinorhizobium meliloti]|uniref:aminotransferase-like domain-containing protein n=1 Tax=Rhizobium meliloti TaxID=382 RepID=UPI000FDCAE1E|nr:PLP-dependent aminotransferase family protein [Sinorhizobium meliloti]MDW9527536.1 aminotransferase class I/II-fold pyridoxal phosphate-dependent enzyme [Sinorhizobium meliloti]MDW9881236.1 aminotransferase class I/II-fold pyridoxal phosphate-dependent enzyme [Sinorhizobium meliloti]MQX44184.1 aminotransferase class I/II-fold pyridoxal phosphate-dependent enzyme [Sinorhizobium meliloti]MQX58196.1 aminotransferase class I/II-fold pyridoxal phosphate-dependent enzyme [Sinorhizobium meliloti]R